MRPSSHFRKQFKDFSSVFKLEAVSRASRGFKSGVKSSNYGSKTRETTYRSSVLWKFWKPPRIIWSATCSEPHITANIMSGFSAYKAHRSCRA